MKPAIKVNLPPYEVMACDVRIGTVMPVEYFRYTIQVSN